MAIKKNDFVEIDFTAKTNNEVFDTTIKEEAEKIGLKDVKPVIISVGIGMLIKGLDKDLEGKELNKKYSIKINPDEAFGKRDSKMVRMIPLKAFMQQKIYPQPGMQLTLDGMLVKILSVSGGRVLVDFNNPLSGKVVEYDYTAKRIIDSPEEKVNALQDFFFRNRFEFEVKEKEVIFKVSENIGKFIQLFEKQFEETLGLKIKIEVKEEKKEEKKQDKPTSN